MAQDGLSINVEAELAKASAAAPTVTEVVSDGAAEEGALPFSDSDDADQSSAFWSKRDVPEADEESSEEEEVEEDSAEEEESVDSSAPFKFRGRGKDFELDPVKDRAEIEKRLSQSEGFNLAFNKAQKLEKQNKSLESRVKDMEPKAKLLEKMQKAYEESGGSAEVAYEIFTGGKSLEEEINRRVQEQLDYREMSDEEKRDFDRAQADRIREEERDRAQRALQREREELDKERFESQADKTHSMAYPAFKSVMKELDIQDRIERQGVAKMLWRQMWDNIRDLDDDVEFTPELFEREAKAAAKLLGHSRKEQAVKEVKKIVEEKKKVAKRKATAATTRNYKRGFDPKKFDGLKPTAIFDKMFGTR